MTRNKLIRNAKWIIACKIGQSLLQLLVGMLCARYLGPADYGLISYAKSVVAFALPLMQLGLDATLVQQLLEEPAREGEILGTSLLLRALSGLLCMGLVCGFVADADPGSPITLAVAALCSASLLLRSMEVFSLWFQSRLQSQYPAVVTLLAYILIAALKIYLLATGKGVLWFAAAYSLEFAVAGAGLLLLYGKKGTQRLSVSVSAAARLLRRSKFYILASLMVVAFQNIDHIMLKHMAGETENGYYAAAVTCSVVVQFVYLAVMDSAQPVILASKRTDPRRYERSISKLYGVIFYLAMAQSAVFTLTAKPIVYILYGADFMAAVPVLQILVWQLAFSYLGTVRNIWILAEEKHARLPLINFCGLLTSGLLNLCLIPPYGACGAAAAAVLTQFFANIVMGFLLPDLRPNNRLLLEGLRPRFAWDTMNQYIRKERLHRGDDGKTEQYGDFYDGTDDNKQ